jgi:hypothetical protein
LQESFPREEFEAERVLALQALESLEDNPARKMFVQLRRVHFPDNYGRSPLGTREGLQALTPGALRDDHAARFALMALFSRWPAASISMTWCSASKTSSATGAGSYPRRRYRDQSIRRVCIISRRKLHSSTSVSLMRVCPPQANTFTTTAWQFQFSAAAWARGFLPKYAKSVVLFIRCRPRPPACAAAACTLAYAGTTPERSQETLDVLLGELRRMAEGSPKRKSSAPKWECCPS